MNKLNMVLSLLAIVALASGCGEEKVEYGYGMCYSALPLNHMYAISAHTYVVQDSAGGEYNIPVVDSNGKHLPLFQAIRERYTQEDSISAIYRPVRIAYEKRQRTKNGEKKEAYYYLTGMEAVPR